MSISEEEIVKKIKLMKALASRRIDEILKVRNVTKPHENASTLINSLFGWLKK